VFLKLFSAPTVSLEKAYERLGGCLPGNILVCYELKVHARLKIGLVYTRSSFKSSTFRFCFSTGLSRKALNVVFFFFTFDFRHINAVGVGLGPAGEWFEARVGEKNVVFVN